MDTNQNALATQNNQDVAAKNDPEVRSIAGRLRYMITDGAKLSDQEIWSLAVYSKITGLDPFKKECWYIPGKGPCPGIRGYRKEAQKKLESEEPGAGHYYNVEWVDVTAEYKETDPTIGYAFEATLRDSRTASKYLALKAKYRKDGLTDEEIIDALGNPPAIKAVGFWATGEKNFHKDKHFLPEERAQKRAEALVLSKRFNLNLETLAEGIEDMQDINVVENSGEIESGDAEFNDTPENTETSIDGEFKDAEPTATQTASTGTKQPTQTTKPKMKAWGQENIRAIVEAGYAKIGNEAANMLNLSEYLEPSMDTGEIVRWAKTYRETRDTTEMNPEAAAQYVDLAIYGKMDDAPEEKFDN